MAGWLGVMPTAEARRADFDQRLIAALTHIEKAVDPLQFRRIPSYVYGWGRAQHCSALMTLPDHSEWYNRHVCDHKLRIGKLNPTRDVQTELLTAALVMR
jgi:hypothetical protein